MRRPYERLVTAREKGWSRLDSLTDHERRTGTQVPTLWATTSRSRCGSGATSGSRCSTPGSSPTCSGSRAPTPSPRSARRTPTWRPARRPATRSAVVGRVIFVRRRRQALLRDPARRRRHRAAGDALPRPGRRGVARAAGRPWSTSATTSASTGEVISSRRGELSVLARRWAITAKALRPLPVDAQAAVARRPGSGSATST